MSEKEAVSNDQLEILRYMANLRARQKARGGVEIVPEMLLRLVEEVKQLRAEVATAEERGRRSGVEERDELRALLGKLVAWADLPATKAVTMSAWVHGVKYRAEDVAVWDEARAALAPRDSASVCDNCKRAAKAKDGRTDRGIPIGPCYCDTLRAPRDSGKEPE